MTEINKGLNNAREKPIVGLLGADVLETYQAIIDYSTLSLFLKPPNSK